MSKCTILNLKGTTMRDRLALTLCMYECVYVLHVPELSDKQKKKVVIHFLSSKRSVVYTFRYSNATLNGH